MIVGVLALQGDFAEHRRILSHLCVESREIRRQRELTEIDALIIPGGESTTVGKLAAADSTIFNAIRQRVRSGMPVYGTCMGAIMLAKQIEESAQQTLGLMDVTVRRNAFGSQQQSFERRLVIPALGDQPFFAVFIRAPVISQASPMVTVMSAIKEGIVMARQENMLVTSFHPELTEDTRVHSYFLSMIGVDQQTERQAALRRSFVFDR